MLACSSVPLRLRKRNRMKITILGHDTMSFLAALDAEGIAYGIHRQRSGQIMNSAGEVIMLAGAAAAVVPWASLAKIAGVIFVTSAGDRD